MKISTIRQLNQLNQRFYSTVADDFDDSRQYYWPGWVELLPLLKKLVDGNGQLKVLDLGCGNGRFGQFLAEKLPDTRLTYHGVDSNPHLLAKAEQTLASTSADFQFKAQDVVDLALSEQLSTGFEGQTYDAIVMFGVMHHIPSFELRVSLIRQLMSRLNPGGHLIFTAWQFADFERFRKKAVSPSMAGIDPQELEPNDFILDWQRGPEALRYCHHLDQTELERLRTALGAKLELEFSADGKEGSVNRYQVLTRSI